MMSPKRGKRSFQTLPPDLLSNLPKNALDGILVRLPLQDVVRTSILSKKWRDIWCGIPELTLDERLWMAPDEEFQLRNGKDLAFVTSNFTKIMYHIFTLHAGLITKFTLCIRFLVGCPNIDNLIYFPSGDDIQDLVLRLPEPEGNLYKLPPSFFTCLQLRHLTLENCLILPPPTFKGFDRLISMELREVNIPSKSLESLKSPTAHCSNTWQCKISLLKECPSSGKIFTYRFGIYRLGRKTLSSLEPLHLEYMCFAAGPGSVAARLPFNLDRVNVDLSDLDEILCTLCLIRSFPYLQYLKIEIADEDSYGIPALECLEVEHFSDVTFNHLREVRLIMSTCSKLEMQLIKLLLAKSPVLVKMLIVPGITEESVLDTINQSATVQMLVEVTKFQRASPTAEVDIRLY